LYIVEAENIVKKLKDKVILNNLTLRVPKGSIYVLAGPNGSGKTTSMRVILGLIKRDSGYLRVLGLDPESREWDIAKSRIGYLPEDAQPYERLTGLEHIVFYARLYSQSIEDYSGMVEKALKIAGLPYQILNSKVTTYSRGMKRRLLLSITLMHNPELALLDEPTSGLDVVSSYRIKEVIREMRGNGTTFIIATHDLKEAEKIADRVGFIAKGSIIAEGTVREILETFNAESLEEAYVKVVGDEF